MGFNWLKNRSIPVLKRAGGIAITTATHNNGLARSTKHVKFALLEAALRHTRLRSSAAQTTDQRHNHVRLCLFYQAGRATEAHTFARYHHRPCVGATYWRPNPRHEYLQ